MMTPEAFLYKPSPEFKIGSGLVSIITRTRGREEFLKRCLKTVEFQSYRNFEHIVVVDGLTLANQSSFFLRSTEQRRVLFLSEQQGRAGAANAGLAEARGEYIVLLDDDDTWDPAFLDRAVSFLRAAANLSYGGVCCWSLFLEEKRGRNGFEEVRRSIQNQWQRSVSLPHLLRINSVFTNAFLYRRECQLSVGVYNPALPVVEDWEFNLRFLFKYEIGVIHEALANYHIRPDVKEPLHGNSLTLLADEHERYDRFIRNQAIRSMIEDNPSQRGMLFAYSRNIFELEDRLAKIELKIARLDKWVLFPVNLIRRLRTLFVRKV